MNLTVDSIVSFTPDHGWIANFKATDGENWTEPVIGWAVVVKWTNYDERAADSCEPDCQMETRLQAVVLDEYCYPTVISEYLEGRIQGCQLVSITPAEQ